MVKICRFGGAEGARHFDAVPGRWQRKPASISSTVTMREMASAMKMMASGARAHDRMMITGPRAILGRLLSTTR